MIMANPKISCSIGNTSSNHRFFMAMSVFDSFWGVNLLNSKKCATESQMKDIQSHYWKHESKRKEGSSSKISSFNSFNIAMFTTILIHFQAISMNPYVFSCVGGCYYPAKKKNYFDMFLTYGNGSISPKT